MVVYAPRRPLSPLAPLALLLTLLAACSDSPANNTPSHWLPGSADNAWHRFDLWVQAPEIEIKPSYAGHQKLAEREMVYLGPAEVRNVQRLSTVQLESVPTLPASEIRALRQMAGSRLRWHVELGQEPYLSFIPLRNEKDSEPCIYRVGVRTADGELAELHNDTARLMPPGPAPVIVDLGAYAGTTVELLLQVDLPPNVEDVRLRALWGSPAVYSRKPAVPPTLDHPNVLLIGADTLRARALGAYGARDTGGVSVTPALDRLAAESDVWLHAISPFNVTNPSFASLMSGLYGKDHGVYNLGTPLPEEHTTLAELYKAAGYDTLAIIAARHLGPQNSGLGQGFDEVALTGRHFTAEIGVDMTMDWVATRDKPFFAWLHLFDPHTPHTPPAPYAFGFAHEEDTGLTPSRGWLYYRSPGGEPFRHRSLAASYQLYPGEIAYMDHQLGRLFDFLRSRGLLENTIIAFVADHGENLEEHGPGLYYRHTGLFETTLHVPLMVRWPDKLLGKAADGHRGRRLEGLVQSVDLFPTLLHAAGLEAPESDGTDLRELTGEDRKGRRYAFSEHAHRQGVRVRTRDYAYMLSYGNNLHPEGAYLFDLREDPEETTNLVGQGLGIEKELHEVLQRWLRQHRQGVQALPADLSEEDLEQLRSLGYL